MKRLSFMTLEGKTLLQLQKWWDVNIYSFFQYLATNKIWPPYKFVRTENHNISNFILPPDTHPKNATAQENYETFSRALRYYIVNCNTICSSKSPKSHVKLITYRNNDNGFDLLVSVVFTMSPQLGGLGPNA